MDDTAHRNKGYILQRLKAATYDNPVTVQAIGNQIGVQDRWQVSQPKVRMVIKELIKEGHPIGSNNNGYFYITNHKQLMVYVESLTGRINGIHDRIKYVRKAYFRIARRHR